jgi:hypothetical protein
MSIGRSGQKRRHLSPPDVNYVQSNSVQSNSVQSNSVQSNPISTVPGNFLHASNAISRWQIKSNASNGFSYPPAANEARRFRNPKANRLVEDVGRSFVSICSQDSIGCYHGSERYILDDHDYSYIDSKLSHRYLRQYYLAFPHPQSLLILSTPESRSDTLCLQQIYPTSRICVLQPLSMKSCVVKLVRCNDAF